MKFTAEYWAVFRNLAMTFALILVASISNSGLVLAQDSAPKPNSVHAIAMHGKPALPADYTHLLFANPRAPKGGKVSYGVVGSFDSANPFILKSMRTSARGMIDGEYGHLVYEPLMMRTMGEPFTTLRSVGRIR